MSGARYESGEVRSAFLAQLADLVATAPGVALAAPAEQAPFLPSRFSFGELDADGTGIDQAVVSPNYVSGRYFPTAGIPILQGRGFDEDGAGGRR